MKIQHKFVKKPLREVPGPMQLQGFSINRGEEPFLWIPHYDLFSALGGGFIRNGSNYTSGNKAQKFRIVEIVFEEL